MPKYNTIRDKITRVRRKNNVTIITDDIPENIKHTFANEKFLKYDSGQEDENRIVVFSTNTHFLHSGFAEHWSCDGTFYACPRQFLQIYSIHASIKGQNFPLVYSLMKNKSEHSYERLFQIVKEKIPNSALKYVSIDFEMSAFLDIRKVFSETQIFGCFFNFTQSLFRRIQKIGISNEFRKNCFLRQAFKVIIALSMVPYENLKNEIKKVDFFVNENTNIFL
ncbi:hypothetical protein DMUE_4608, partial [Dictyocoela muelleri]